MKIHSETFGHFWGEEARRYTLQNDNGMALKITNYGGIITHWHVPDRTGKPTDIVLGFDTLAGYLAGHPYFGALVGRFANRIRSGRFELNGQTFELAAQDRGNHLHGGLRGFDKYIWRSQTEEGPNYVRLILQHRSPHMDEGYPGNLEVEVHYTLRRENCLAIDYFATTDQATIVNLTNHSYFNLSGKPEQGIGEHSIQIHAGSYLEVDEQQIPTGRRIKMEGSPLDCRRPRNMAELFAQAPAKVVDHCYVLENPAPNEPSGPNGQKQNAQPNAKLHEAAVAEAASSGIRLRLKTGNAALQFYNGNKLGNLPAKGKHGGPYLPFAGFCLETQAFPDAPNHPHFPSCVLLPGQNYRHRAEFHLETFT